MVNAIRLTKEKISLIKDVFYKYFSSEDAVWLFGSRVDDEAKGGDIDLYLESHLTDIDKLWAKKSSFLLS